MTTLMTYKRDVTPAKGSFWERDHGSPIVGFISHPQDDTKCIGKVTRVHARRYRATLYEKPFPFTTNRKEAPAVKVYRFLPTAGAAAEWIVRNAP